MNNIKETGLYKTNEHGQDIVRMVIRHRGKSIPVEVTGIIEFQGTGAKFVKIYELASLCEPLSEKGRQYLLKELVGQVFELECEPA